MSNNYMKRTIQLIEGGLLMYKILIADDNREFNELLSEYLSKEEDMEIVGNAFNGKEVLELVKENNPDIILILSCLTDGSVLEELNNGTFSETKSNHVDCFWP